MPEASVHLELGCDHDRYGNYAFGWVDPHTAWAMSVGADEHSPSRGFKGNLDVPNEDCLLAVADGDAVLMAVADAHFGAESSHELLTELAERCRAGEPLPATPEDLQDVFAQFEDRPPRGFYRSETTLLVAVFDRTTRTGFGLSYGDSTLAVVGSAGYRPGVDTEEDDQPQTDSHFVSFARPETFALERSMPFEFAADPGDLVLVFTDGVNECHYREPLTSITPEIMSGLFVSLGHETEAYVRGIVELAMTGVDGSPGGQDNIAFLATRA